MGEMPKYCKRPRLITGPVQHMSGWHVRSLLFTFCWFLLALFCLTAVWKVLSFLFLSHISWPDSNSYADWGLWTPPINVFTEPTWGIRRWWPTYVAKKILPSRGSTVFVFSSVSPFHDASHLTDPWSFGEREQAQQLLTAVVHGLITRIIWVYPSWYRQASGKFHDRATYHVGLSVIELPKSDERERSWKKFASDGVSSSNSKQSIHTAEDSNWIGAICVCDEHGKNCSLPFLYPLFPTISSSACTQNATVIYESVIDLVAETLVSTGSTSPSPFDERPSRLHQMISGFRKYIGPSDHWLSDSIHPHHPPSHVILLDTSYFGHTSSSVVSSLSPRSSEMVEPPDFAGLLIDNYRIHLQHVHDDLRVVASSVRQNKSLSLYLTRFYVRMFFLLLPTEPTEWIASRTNASYEKVSCGRRSPFSVLPGSSSEYENFRRWRSVLSTPFTHSANQTCERMRLLVWTLLSVAEPSVVLNEAAYHLWHWLCKLERPKLTFLAQWIPCYDQSMFPAQAKQTASHLAVRLCPHSKVNHQRSHLVDKIEFEFLLDRLQVILRHLSIPRYIAVVSRSRPKPEDSLDPLQAMCDRFKGLY